MATTGSGPPPLGAPDDRSTNLIRLDTVVPVIEGFTVSRRVMRVGERTRIGYRFKGGAHPIVLVDGWVAVFGRFARTTGTVDWFGKFAASAAWSGIHSIPLEARDDAGNTSKRTPSISIRLTMSRPVSHRGRRRG